LLKSPNESQISLSEFRDTTAKLLRVALQKAVGMATPDGRIGVNWDDLIVPP
jgi:hypothetical protein